MSEVHAGFDATGTTCTGHAQQGTVNLNNALHDVYGCGTAGIYACRPPRGQTTGLSEHGEGRADDPVPPGTGDAYIAKGWEIANRLVERNAELGVEEVIWQRKLWSYPHRDEGWRDYHGSDPHTSHVHVGQNWSGAWFLQYADAVRVLGGQPAPTPIPQTEDDYMLPRVMHWQGAIFLVGYDPNPFEILDEDDKTVVGEAIGPWRKTFPNPSRLAQVVGGGACVTDHGNAFEVTNNEFRVVYQNRGPA